MKALITGAAGYLGSTIASAFLDAGDDVVLVDDLSRGSCDNLPASPAYLGDVGDRELLDEIFFDHPDIEVAVHCAARIVSPQSVREPLLYYRENVAKSLSLFEALTARGCPAILFSSSAAVYGPAVAVSIDEGHPVAPATPYGASKLMVERILADLSAAYGCSTMSLRYFNPVGVDPQLRSGPRGTSSPALLPALLRTLHDRLPVTVHGGDWPTTDGTPVRDFVDVWDLALAHVAAAHRLRLRPTHRHDTVNLGSGVATTVGELVAHAARALDARLVLRTGPRRIGEHDCAPAALGRAGALFGWRPRRTVYDSVDAAVRWHRLHTQSVIDDTRDGLRRIAGMRSH